jgi:hypothetical protein
MVSRTSESVLPNNLRSKKPEKLRAWRSECEEEEPMVQAINESEEIIKVADEALASVSGSGGDEENITLVTCPYRDCGQEFPVEKGKAAAMCIHCHRPIVLQGGTYMVLPDQPADGLV